MDRSYDENWMIVRSAKNIPEYAKQVVDLSPSTDLFFKFRKAANNNEFNDKWFESVYVPQFIKELKNNDNAIKLLAQLWDDSKSKNIYLCCFCSNESICHRSIIAGILLGSGAQIECNKEYIKYWDMYQTAK